MISLLRLSSLVVVLSSIVCGQNAPLSPTSIFKRSSPSVFVVEALDWEGNSKFSGSGIAVGPNVIVTTKYIATAAVSRGSERNGANLAYERRIRQGSRTWRVSRIYIDPHHDLARLEVKGLSATPVAIRRGLPPQVGEQAFVIASPEGQQISLLPGMISGLREIGKAKIAQFSAPLSGGAEGGGLFDDRGRLVGIMSRESADSLGFALSPSWFPLCSRPFSDESLVGKTSVNEKLWIDTSLVNANFHQFASVASGLSGTRALPAPLPADISLTEDEAILFSIAKKDSPQSFYNWPEWRKAWNWMDPIRETLTDWESIMAEPATDEIARRRKDLASSFAVDLRKRWSNIVDVYCKELPEDTYTDLEGKTRGCPNAK